MWNDSVVTAQGLALLARAQLGETITLDGASAGSATVEAAELRNLTEIRDERQQPAIVSKRAVDGGAEIKLQFQAADAGYTARQIGLWAHIGEAEKQLIAVYQDAEGVYIPSGAELAEFVYSFYAVIEMDNPGALEAVIDPKAYLTMDTLQEALDGVRTDALRMSAAIPNQGWPERAPYALRVSCPGIRADDIALIDLADDGEDDSLRGAWSRIERVGIEADALNVRASAVPAVEIPIRVLVIRGPREGAWTTGDAFLLRAGGAARADDIQGTLGIEHGGTGAITAEAAREKLGAAAKAHTHKAGDVTEGVLDKARGGTGRADGRAEGLAAARELQVNLANTEAATFDGTAAVKTIGVSGMLGIEHGGTGAAAAPEALNKLGITWAEALPDSIENGHIYLVLEAEE